MAKIIWGKEESMRSQVLYEDRHVIVVHKPAGIAVQTARLGQQDVVSELKNYLCHSNEGNGMHGGRREPYLGIIHRLDQPVEGLLVFAKTKDSAANLTAQLRGQGEEGTFCKRYYAVLCGIPKEKEGRLTDYLRKQAVKNGKYIDYRAVIEEPDTGRRDSTESRDHCESRICSTKYKAETACLEIAGQGDPGEGSRNDIGDKTEAGKEKAQRAELEYRILQVQEEQGIALADITIHTGRFHQIRAQMAHRGMPLLGDGKYGSSKTKALAQRLGIRNVALCACQLGFVHPVSKEKMDFHIKPDNPAFSSFSQL